MNPLPKIPGPSRWRMLRDLPKPSRDLTGYLVELRQRYGPTFLLPLRYPTYVLTLPDDIKHILVTNPRNYHKTGGLTVGKELFGQGLVSSEPPLHTKQRKLMQPMFHRTSIARFATLMTDSTTEHLRGWRGGTVIDLAVEMMELTMAIVGQALFSIDLRTEARELGLAYTTAQRLVTRRQRQVPIPVWVPTPTNRRYRAAIAQINRSVHELIATRRQLAEQPPDLLGMLLNARFEDGTPMPDGQMRDEVATLLMAGHETVANTLNWTFYLLSQHPEVEAKLHAEWAAVLAGRAPRLEDLAALRYTDMVLAESMRLYPPAWTLARRAVGDDQLPSGLQLRAGVEVILSQYICHRNADVFPEPERFDPERWTPEFKKEVSPFVYFPFGAGPRYCIGEQFARVEAALLLAAIGQQFKLRLVPGHPIGKEPLISLRPRYGLKMELHARP